MFKYQIGKIPSKDTAKSMINKLISAVSFSDIDEFHKFMAGFKSSDDIFFKHADILCEKIKSEKGFLDSFDFFVFVPSTTNYSKKLAEYISAKLGKPCKNGILQKIKSTRELKTLPRQERAKEIKNSFTARLKGGERICVVDDVSASGATLNEISSAFKKAGAPHVCAVVAAILF